MDWIRSRRQAYGPDVPCALAAQLNGEVEDGAAVVLDLSAADTAKIAVTA